MTYHYQAIRSEIFEKTMLPTLSYAPEDREWDFTQKESSILADDFAILDELYQLFLPYQGELRTYHFMGEGIGILTTAYLYLLNQGHDPQSMEDFHELVLAMTEEDIDYCLRFMLRGSGVSEDLGKSFLELLEEVPWKPETKWRFLIYTQAPLENLRKTVNLSRELQPLYQPYFEKAAAERQFFANHLSMDKLFAEADVLKAIQHEQLQTDAQLIILSSWFIRLMLIPIDEFSEGFKTFVVLSCKIDQVLLSHRELDEDNFNSVLKSLSDLTRYKVLVALTQPHVKGKDIAAELGISSAAVSFHRQKLMNAMLLMVNDSDKAVKYDANKDLLRSVIEKLKVDFSL
ncbi:ArsR family transcriptional regulator [Streptococcus gallolyticus]|uniref:ArsR family transcriptional regulator n=1 Tax=Streptococcus hepaticus TaxID=3349163 RepID=UPI001C968D64|nr:ArsR family transcriptional regulator [Streptococcus gallolyticus]MBY5041140.1 ArsR family transcriptional regulator [Streptococcus gallolyticus]